MLKKWINNFRKPTNSIGGIYILNHMNEKHNELSLWGLSHLSTENISSCIDLGCGGGQNIKNLRTMFPSAKVTGLDYSSASVKKSKRTNSADIRNNMVEVVEGDVSRTNFEDNSFEIATAFETTYFWNNIVDSIKEVHRILKENGQFLICNEASDPKIFEEYKDKIGMNVYTEKELVAFMKEAGFSKVSSFAECSNVSVIGIK